MSRRRPAISYAGHNDSSFHQAERSGVTRSAAIGVALSHAPPRQVLAASFVKAILNEPSGFPLSSNTLTSSAFARVHWAGVASEVRSIGNGRSTAHPTRRVDNPSSVRRTCTRHLTVELSGARAAV